MERTLVIEDLFRELPQLRDKLPSVGRSIDCTEEIDISFYHARKLYEGNEGYIFKEIHLNCALAEVCKSLVDDSSGLWWHLWKDFDKRANHIASKEVY